VLIIAVACDEGADEVGSWIVHIGPASVDKTGSKLECIAKTVQGATNGRTADNIELRLSKTQRPNS
jgi:hypothetical protein